MVLDAQAQTFLELLAGLDFPELGEVPVEVSRKLAAERRLRLPPGPDVNVSDHHVPAAGGSILVRLYKPKHDDAARAPGVLVWMHGGGFVLGSVVESDADCRHLCQRSGCAIASVDYRRAPEHPFPTATDDAF